MDFGKLKEALNDKMTLAYVVTFTALGIFGFILLVKFDLGSLYRRQKSFAELNANLGILEALVVYRDYINSFNAQFTLREKGTDWLTDTISEKAKKKSVPLGLVKPIEGTISFGYRKISVLVEGRASYHDMAEFISDLENSEKYVIIEKFELRTEEIKPFFARPGSEISEEEALADMERKARFSLIVSSFESEKGVLY